MIRLILLTVLILPGYILAKDIPYLRCFEIASERHDVPLDLLVSIARVESNFDPDARSHAGAHGIMQVRWPVTARHLGVRRVAELYNPCVNIDVGASYVRELLDRYQENERLTLAAYNYGPTRLRNEADIPGRVNNYVNRVLAVDYFDNAAHVSGEAELNQFRSHATAQRYANILNRRLADSPIRIIRKKGPVYRVVVDQAQLSAIDRFQLNRLVGDF